MVAHSDRGVNISVFLAEGKPEGLRLIEVSNWTGLVLVTGLGSPKAFFNRAEAHSPGIYLLTSSNGDEPPSLYIGESEDVANRIRQHLRRTEDYWQQVITATVKDSSLNKAHIKWLENRLINLAKSARRATLKNGNVGTESSLHEADIATLESYLDDFLMIIKLFGIDAFEIGNVAQAISVDGILSLKGAGSAEASGYETESGFLVSSGFARRSETTSVQPWITQLRLHLIDSGIFELDNSDRYLLTAPYEFNSPSAAAAAVMGRSANGLLEWKDASGTTLRDIRQSRTL